MLRMHSSMAAKIENPSDRTPSIEPIESPMQQRPKIWRAYTRRGKGGQSRES